MNQPTSPHLVATGFALKHPDLFFNPAYPHTCCKICGAVFQSPLDRNPLAGVPAMQEQKLEALLKRRDWSLNHAKTHTEAEHDSLAASGRWCTPEAAQRLTAYGIIPLVDMVTDEEVEDALKNGHVIPVEDCEGG